MFLKIVYWILLVPFSILSLASIVSLFDGSLREQRSKLTQAIGFLALSAPGVVVVYSLFIDWAAAIWLIVAFALMLVAAAALLYGQLTEEGKTLNEGIAFIKEAWKAARPARQRSHQVTQQSANTSDETRSVATFSVGTDIARFLWAARWLIASQMVLYVIGYLALPFVYRVFGPAAPLALDSDLLILVVIGALVAGPFVYSEEFLYKPEAQAEPVLIRIGIGTYFLGGLLSGLPVIAIMFGTLLSNAVVDIPMVCLGAIFLNGSRLLLHACTFKTASEVMASDVRPPVLYLRSFNREGRLPAWIRRRRDAVRQLSVLGSVAHGLIRSLQEHDEEMAPVGLALSRAHKRRTLYGRLSERSWAMQLASGRIGFPDEQSLLADMLNQIGPYIAVKRPGQAGTWADVGAYKLPMPCDRWQSQIGDIISKARIVVVEAGETKGIMWELEQVISRVPPRKVLLVVPDTWSEYSTFLNRTKNMFLVPLPSTLPNTRFLMFDDWWNPIALENKKEIESDLMLNESSVHILVPFFKRNDIDGSSEIRIAPL